MSPRRGGESDKLGNRYEEAWTVRHLLYVLNGDVDSITIEDIGDFGEGAEFTVRRAGTIEVHQLKRQHGLVNNWSERSLESLSIWRNARRHIQAGRQFRFVSTVPARTLQELSTRARQAANLRDFIDKWLSNEELRKSFNTLAALKSLGTPDIAFDVLHGFWIEWHDELELLRMNSAVADFLLEGASGRLATAGLGDLAAHNPGVELTCTVLEQKLPEYDLRRASVARTVGVTERLAALNNSWLAYIEAQLLVPPIARHEADELRAAIWKTNKVVTLVGDAGVGKSAVLRQTITTLEVDNTAVLCFRLDRLERFASSVELGKQLGLDVSPVTALAVVAQSQPSVLVIDQLDAVSFASGRLPENFDVVANLVREASAFPQMKVVMACRGFDVDNDNRIRELSRKTNSILVSVGPLSDVAIDSAVCAMGLSSAALRPAQRVLLRSPLHLVLLATVASEPHALDFQTSGHLLEAYWSHKRRCVRQRREGVRFDSVMSAVANAISSRQSLSVAAAVLDHDDLANDADVLISEHVLIRDGLKIAFSHETLFDYAFARHWTEQGESLADFLVTGEQELFRRRQVRQILSFLRQTDPERFVDETNDLLRDNRVRFHIKEAALAILGALADPTAAEAHMVLTIAANDPPYRDRLWYRLRAPAWFDRLDAEGFISEWLRGTIEDQSLALNMMAGGTRAVPDRIAELLSQHQNELAYATWLRSLVRLSQLDESRPLFDLFLDAVRDNAYEDREHEMWLAVHDLHEEQPTWAVEFLKAFLVDRPRALQLGASGKVTALQSTDHTAAKFVRRAAQLVPREFYSTLVPYLFAVMEAAGSDFDDGYGFRPDRHFSHQYPRSGPDSDFDDALFDGMTTAVDLLVKDDPQRMRQALEHLATQEHDSAQWLLYHGVLSAGETYAEWAANLVLEDQRRLFCGYASNSVWITRLVLQCISPRITNELHARLEDYVRDLRFPWEKQGPWYAFCLLSALQEDRLSLVGQRRLGEYQRLYEVDQPPEPVGVTGGIIGPPISLGAAQRMNDENWLSAIAKHAGEHERWATLTGGAREMAQVLRSCTKDDPARFARLALRLTSATHPAYGDAILWGLGEAATLDSEELVFDAVRYIAAFGNSGNDRWLGWCIRPYLKTVPLDIVALIAERATTSPDPSDGGKRFSSESKISDLEMFAINTTRGTLAQALGDLLVYDIDGSRTELVEPILLRLANDPALSVRVSVAHTIAAAMRYAYSEALLAFKCLIKADDLLLATQSVQRLINYIGNREPILVVPIAERMLTSAQPEVREAGGQLAAFAAMEWDVAHLLRAVQSSDDSDARMGAAGLCAYRLPCTSKIDICFSVLAASLTDSDGEVRKAAADAASALRGQRLEPFATVLRAVIASEAFEGALPQLLITLEHAPDRVDRLVLLCAQRFVDALGTDAADIRTSAAGDVTQVGELIIRGLAQSRGRNERSALLDVLDDLLRLGAYGIDELIIKSER